MGPSSFTTVFKGSPYFSESFWDQRCPWEFFRNGGLSGGVDGSKWFKLIIGGEDVNISWCFIMILKDPSGPLMTPQNPICRFAHLLNPSTSKCHFEPPCGSGTFSTVNKSFEPSGVHKPAFWLLQNSWLHFQYNWESTRTIQLKLRHTRNSQAPIFRFINVF